MAVNPRARYDRDRVPVRLVQSLCLITALFLAGCQPESSNNYDSMNEASRPSESMLAEQEANPNTRSPAIVSKAPAIKIENGKISVSLEKMPLRQLAAELSARSDIRVELIGVFPDTGVSAKFSDYGLETGFRYLLKDFNTIFVYSDIDESQEGSSQLARVLVLPGNDNNEIASGTRTIDELVSRMSERLQLFAPVSDPVSVADYPEVDLALEQEFFEVGKYLNDISIVSEQ